MVSVITLLSLAVCSNYWQNRGSAGLHKPCKEILVSA